MFALLFFMSVAFAQEVPCHQLDRNAVNFHCAHLVNGETINACAQESQTAKSAAFKNCVAKFSLQSCIANKSTCEVIVSEPLQESLSCQALTELKSRWKLELTVPAQTRYQALCFRP